MNINYQQKGKKKQHGLVLLVMVVVIFLAVSSYYFSSISIVEIKTDNIQKTQNALKQAKQALISYATLRSDVPDPSLQPGKYGYLPCPANTNGDGNSVGSCGVKKTSYIGWFPWRSLGMPPLIDGNGDCLLYAVSSTYKYNPEAGMLNEDTNFGMFQVIDENGNIIHGDAAQNRVVAIVFSAGTALSGQNRNKDPDTECGNDANNFAAYLDAFEIPSGDIVNNSDVDGIDINQIDRFVQAASVANKGIFNDQFVVITRDEVWPQAIAHRGAAFDVSDTTGASKVRRLTEALARCLASYANANNNSSLPFPAAMDFAGNDYRDNAEYTDAHGVFIGRYPYITDNSDTIIPGSVANNELFTKAFGAGISNCNALTILLPPGVNANLNPSPLQDKEDIRLWNNWKDRIIYSVSERYVARTSPGVDLVQPRCNDPLVTNNKCVTYNGTEYAAMIIYAGEALSVLPQTREAPIAAEDAGIVTNTKLDIYNYIEVAAPVSGAGDDNFNPETSSNDLYFCLTDAEPVAVIECI